MKDLNKGKSESSSPKKFLDDVISSYYECNPKEKNILLKKDLNVCIVKKMMLFGKIA